MNTDSLNIVILGLSLSSSWGNGHATTFRSLVKGLDLEGHNITFLERNVEWYASNRDLEASPHCELIFYDQPEALHERFDDLIINSDLVIVGSYLKDGVSIAGWITKRAKGITAFYDIDTPVTMAKLEQKDYEYIHPSLIPEFDLYLSFSGGKVLRKLEDKFGASAAKALYCSVDPDLYYPQKVQEQWKLGYMGTYSADRQTGLNELLLKTASRHPADSFVVAGPQYPADIPWPENVNRIEHLPPAKHVRFYNRQRFTLNLTRDAMIQAGFSPSVRLFEAAACGTPIISDEWEGLEEIFEPGVEILIAKSSADVQHYLSYSHKEITALANRARQKVMQKHTARERAKQLISYVREFNAEPGYHSTHL